jgi:hypothetical protein
MHAEECDERDELDETIAEYMSKHPDFPALFAAAKQRRATEREQRARQAQPDEEAAVHTGAAMTSPPVR